MNVLFENPELVRYVRCAVRGGKMVFAYSLFLLVVLADMLVNVWAMARLDSYASPAECFKSIFFQIIGLNSVVLLLVGAHTTSTAAGMERRLGTLDFQRITGLSPYWLALGKIVGAPFQYFIMTVAAMPFTMVCVLTGGISIAGYGVTYAALLASGLVFSAAGMLISSFGQAKTAKPGSSVGVLIVGLVLLSMFLPRILGGRGGGFLLPIESRALGCLLPVSSLVAVGRGSLGSYQVMLFGVRLSGVVMTLICNALVFLALWAGSARRIMSDTRSAWSKPQLCVGTVAAFAFILGVVFNHGSAPAVLYFAPAFALLTVVSLVGATKPYQCRLWLRRTIKRRSMWQHVLSEGAPILPLVMVLAALCAVSAFGSAAAASASGGRWHLAFLASAAKLLSATLMSAALAQLISLAAPTYGSKLTVLALVLWIVSPFLATALISAAAHGHTPEWATYLGSLSPLGPFFGSDSHVLLCRTLLSTVLFTVGALILMHALRRATDRIEQQIRVRLALVEENEK